MRKVPSLSLFAGTLLSRLKKSEESLSPIFLSYSYIYRTESSLPYRLYPVYASPAMVAQIWRYIYWFL
jgi:hypothetical protein